MAEVIQVETDSKGHRQRIKNKYLENPASLVYDYEVLELLLTYSIPRKDVKPVAKELIARFGDIDGVFNASVNQLVMTQGVGENTAALISLVKDISVRCKKCKSAERAYIGDYKSACEYFRNLLEDEAVEKFMLASIDNAGRVISCQTLAQGGVSKVSVPPRAVIESAMADNAASVIIAHNHPKGSADPSADDINYTLNIRTLFQKLGIELVDHIIVGEGSVMSMRNSHRYSIYFKKAPPEEFSAKL